MIYMVFPYAKFQSEELKLSKTGGHGRVDRKNPSLMQTLTIMLNYFVLLTLNIDLFM